MKQQFTAAVIGHLLRYNRPCPRVQTQLSEPGVCTAHHPFGDIQKICLYDNHFAGYLDLETHPERPQELHFLWIEKVETC